LDAYSTTRKSRPSFNSAPSVASYSGIFPQDQAVIHARLDMPPRALHALIQMREHKKDPIMNVLHKRPIF
jgi:hypothetical protein